MSVELDERAKAPRYWIERAQLDVPVRILTNGSRAARPAVRDARDRLDERIVELDAEPERICRPSRGDPLDAQLFAIGLLRDVMLQSRFVAEMASNTDPAAVRARTGIEAGIFP